MLSNYIKQNQIKLQITAENWKEAVFKCGEILVKNKICELRYIDAMINVVERLGPYMVIAPGIALAHARPEDGALRVGMSIVSLKTPVNFGSRINDPVELVIGFTGIDTQSHIGMLKDLAVFLMDEQNQKILKTATRSSDVVKAFNNEKRDETR